MTPESAPLTPAELLGVRTLLAAMRIAGEELSNLVGPACHNAPCSAPATFKLPVLQPDGHSRLLTFCTMHARTRLRLLEREYVSPDEV